MSYNLNDLYTASGSAKLYGCWTDEVSKFHPGLFYNFETDNLPIHDIEERTDFLWEQLGYPTSSLPGMVLLVSADAPASVVGCNKNIFNDLSSALSVVPKFLNYPLIIEVASFGPLGNLDFTDVQMGPSGSIEVINRPVLDDNNTGAAVDGFASSRVSVGPHGSYDTLSKNVSGDSVSKLFQFFSFLGGVTDGYQPSTLTLGTHIYSSTYPTIDARARNNFTAFYSSPPATNNEEVLRLSVANWTLPATVVASIEASATLFEETAGDEVALYDPSAYKQYAGIAEETFRYFPFTAGAANTVQKVLAYGNSLDRIRIYNCNGPIYIRNFYCSGDGSTTKIGIDVKDSVVHFDSIAVNRYTQYGIRVLNSNVDFSKSICVNRCYGFDASGDRQSGLWTENVKGFDAPRDDSAGIYAVNSEINFDTAVEHNNQFGTYRPGTTVMRTISRNSTGMRLINCVVRGGEGRLVSSINIAPSLTQLDIISLEGNANYGMEIENSRFYFAGRLEAFQNTRGIKAINSNLCVEEFSFDNNHHYGAYLDNSEFRYNLRGVSATDRFDFDDLTLIPTFTYPKRYSYRCYLNGQHLVLKNSTFKPNKFGGDIPSYYGRMVFVDAHGASDETENHLLPAVQADSSLLELIHSTSIRDGVTNMVARGAHFLAQNGSEIKFLGSPSSMTSFLGGSGTPTYEEMKRYAAIVAENNSTAIFRGPTVIYDGAVNVLADRNSNIIFEPHKKQDGLLDISGWNLTNPQSHTMVEMKAYRACLVADNGSNISMVDLGDYRQAWGDAYASSTNYETSTTGYNFTPYVSAGFMQFYPNPNDIEDYTTVASQVLATRGTQCRMNNTGSRYYWAVNPFGSDPFDLSAVTQGGMCLRALNGSHVRVRNTHFPCGWWNPSSVIYDTSAADEYCSRLFIWNFAGGSTMNADHVTVSGLYPSLAGYHGPSALWLSGAGALAYGAPTGTPDTSSLSILDAFGQGFASSWPLPNGTLAFYGQSSFENQGPFRLYMGVDSLANNLYHVGSLPGAATQIMSQGYNPSAALASDSTLSGVYGKVVRITPAGALESSGFYYANEFVESNPTLIMLDESAANLFANAKNGAMGTSNRPQICMIYSAKTTDTGEAKYNSSTSLGRGFKSPNVFDLLEES